MRTADAYLGGYRPLAGRLGALAERDFRLLGLGQATSAFGDGLVPVALAFAVVELAGSTTDLGLVFAAILAPRVALLLAGGVWADRLPRQLVMLAADAVRCLTQALLAVLLLTGTARLWQLLVLAAIYGAADAFFSPAATGLVPELVRPERLQQANALLSLTRSASWLVGPAVAGVLVTTVGPGSAFAVDAATFAVSTLCLALIRLPRRPSAATRASFLADLRGGWREVRARTWVWASILYFAVWNVAMGPVYVLGPFVSEQSLGGAASWGLIVSAAGLGSLVGGVLALRFRPRRPLLVGYLGMGTCALEAALLARPFPTAAIAAAAAVGLGAVAFATTVWLTTLQERIPRKSISRVSAYDWLGSIVFQPLGYLLVGPIAAAVGPTTTLLGSALVVATASVAIAVVPGLRGVRR